MAGAPLYTNNRLTPTARFRIAEQLRKTDQVLDISVKTDPSLAMRTRPGTGFYNVPSLRGVRAATRLVTWGRRKRLR
jgi:hypothetical protein